MAIRVKHKVLVQTYRDTSEKNGYYTPDDSSSEVILDGFDKQCNSNLKVPQNTSELLDFGDVDVVKGVYIEANVEAKLKLNGSTDELQLRKGSTLAGTKAKFFFEGDISSVEVVAPTDEDVVGEYCVWGDTTP